MMDSFAGGYMPWKCGADTELIHRLGSSIRLYNLEKSVFYRRLHSKSLTLNPETGFNSELRNSYKKQIKKEYSKEEIYIPRTTAKFTKDSVGEYSVFPVHVALRRKVPVTEGFHEIENAPWVSVFTKDNTSQVRPPVTLTYIKIPDP